MLTLRLAAISIVLSAVLSSCTTPTAFPPPVPSPMRKWSIALSQSGGFAGVNLIVRVDSSGAIAARDDRTGRDVTRPLSAPDLQELERLISVLSIRDAGGRPTMCADCFLYDLEVEEGGRITRWHGDDTTLATSGAADLIQLLTRLRDDSLSRAD